MLLLLLLASVSAGASSRHDTQEMHAYSTFFGHFRIGVIRVEGDVSVFDAEQEAWANAVVQRAIYNAIKRHFPHAVLARSNGADVTMVTPVVEVPSELAQDTLLNVRLDLQGPSAVVPALHGSVLLSDLAEHGVDVLARLLDELLSTLPALARLP